MRRLYKTPGLHLTLGQVVGLNRRLLEGYDHFKDEPRVQKLRQDVLKYNRLVRDLGLRDHQVTAVVLFLTLIIDCIIRYLVHRKQVGKPSDSSHIVLFFFLSGRPWLYLVQF